MQFIGFALPLHPALAALTAAMLGLLAGPWLARCVLALPEIMEFDWDAQCREHRGEALAPRPRPRLFGRSPGRGMTGVVQACAATLFAACTWRFGVTLAALCAVVFAAALLVLACIDLRTRLLPDAITQPLLWLGLLVNLAHVFTSPTLAIAGAALGYAFLWLLFHAFRRVTGREGMGYGDFKLLGALGAWLGLGALPWLLLSASVVGAVVGLTLVFLRRVERGQPQPFGPYLAAAAIAVLIIRM